MKIGDLFGSDIRFIDHSKRDFNQKVHISAEIDPILEALDFLVSDPKLLKWQRILICESNSDYLVISTTLDQFIEV
jgi:hypothetical protein